jgi:hypothetical protein
MTVYEAFHAHKWLLSLFLFIGPFVLISSIPAWILAAPIVLTVRRVDGWKFWVLLALGTFIGPISLFAFSILRFVLAGKIEHYDINALTNSGFAAGTAFVATAVYLLLVKRASNSAIA